MEVVQIIILVTLLACIPLWILIIRNIRTANLNLEIARKLRTGETLTDREQVQLTKIKKKYGR